MLKQHMLEHMNTFIVVQCMAFIIGSAIYGWKNAYKEFNVKKSQCTNYMKIRNSGNYIGKMLFVFSVSAGVSWVIDYMT